MIGRTRSFKPTKCVFEATLACNLRCKHCGSRAGKARENELTGEEARSLFVQLAELGCERVTIAGGEPTVRSDWPELIRDARAAGLRVGMITNGIRFDAEAARLAKQNGLESVGFSIDGIGPVHDEVRGRRGHYEIVMGAIENARSAELPFSTLTHINRLNYRTLPEMHQMLVELGTFAWQVQLGTDMGNMSDHKELLIAPDDLPALQETLAELIQKRTLRIDVSDSIGYFGPSEKHLRRGGSKCFPGCQAGMRVIGIESNGNVKGCLSIMAGYNEQGEQFVEGNIREQPLAEIWNAPDAFAYNRRFSLANLDGFCGSCKQARKCRGGCYAKRVASGDGVENPMCAYRVIMEQAENSPARAGLVAASVLAGVMGTTTIACDNVTGPRPMPDYGAPYWETSSETDTSMVTPDYSDPGTDFETDTETATETETDTYSMVTDYSDPGWETDTQAVPIYDMAYRSDTDPDGDPE